MNQQPQMDEARAAVKQQLLRTLMQQAVEELAADSQQQIDRQISEISLDLGPARERVRALVQAKKGAVHAETEERVRDMVRSECEASWAGIDMEAIVADSLEATAPEFALGEEVISLVRTRIEEQSRAQMEVFIRENVQASLEGLDISSAVKTAISSRVSELSAHMLDAGSESRDEVLAESLSSVISRSDVVDSIASDVRTALVQRIADRTVDGLGDADRLSKEARALVTFDQDDIIAATTILRTRIIQDIARRTARSLGNRDELATDAELWISASDPELEPAVAAAKESLTQHIESELRNVLRVPDTLGKAAAERVVDESGESLASAVSATRERLIEIVSGLAEEQLVDTDAIAARAADSIPTDAHDVQRILKATMSLIVAEVIAEAEGRLLHVEKLSSEARTRMAESLPGVEQAADMLERMLVEEVSTQAHERLSKSDEVARSARDILDAAPEMDAARTALLSMLFNEIARHAEEDLSDTDRATREAWERIDLESQTIFDVTEALQDNVLREVAERVLRAVSDVKTSVTEAMVHVPGDAPEIGQVASSLRERILATVIADTLRSLGQSAEKSATGDDMSLLRNAMTAVLDTGSASMSWTTLSDMDEDHENESCENADEGAEKPWSVSELLTAGDGAHTEAPGMPDAAVPETEDAKRTLLYVYGILDIDALDTDAIESIEGLAPGTRLEFHTWEDLCAVMSRVPVSTYGDDALRHAMTDAAWTKQQVAKHANILSALPGVDSLVPLPFGEVFERAVDLDDFLAERHEAFRDALSRLSNRKEFSLRMQVDMHALREHFMASDARIDASLNDMTHGVAGFIREELKLTADAPDESQLVTIIQNIVGNTHSRLLGVASEGLLKNVPANSDATRRVVLNASYLVSEAREAEFKAAVSAIAAEYDDLGVEMQLSGPWMAYHFTHIPSSNAHAM
ncbi:MAG: hypothetical protein COV99_04035 [Bacteroidetes bacterium CG12_big_fil_rev_8_21_14_0_65_60_17]|nr:MAG: hypothetical protein COV99_04035 [Bacteroidetes bacterium CG12_big_fil_rev_8_21_14_0_65_60_17]